MKKPEIEVREFGAMGPDGFEIIINHKMCYVVKTEAEAEAIEGMITALIGLCFLNQCELEGLQSGQPTANDWCEAFEKTEQALKKAGVEL